MQSELTSSARGGGTSGATPGRSAKPRRYWMSVQRSSSLSESDGEAGYQGRAPFLEGASHPPSGSGAPLPLLGDDSGRAAHIAMILQAVAHPVRLRILSILCEGEMHVNGLVERLGVPQSGVSQQLRILRLNLLVSSRRQRGMVQYQVQDPRVKELIRNLELEWPP